MTVLGLEAAMQGSPLTGDRAVRSTALVRLISKHKYFFSLKADLAGFGTVFELG